MFTADFRTEVDFSLLLVERPTAGFGLGREMLTFNGFKASFRTRSEISAGGWLALMVGIAAATTESLTGVAVCGTS